MFRSILASAAIPATPWNEDDSKIGSREMGLYREPRKPSTAKALAISIVGMAAIVLFAWIAFYVVAVFQFSVK